MHLLPERFLKKTLRMKSSCWSSSAVICKTSFCLTETSLFKQLQVFSISYEYVSFRTAHLFNAEEIGLLGKAVRKKEIELKSSKSL